MQRDDSGSWRRDDDPGEPSTGKPRLSVTDLEASILSALVHNLTVVEIGTGLGVSTKALARTANRVHTVDIDPWVHSDVWPTLPPNVIRHKDTSKLPAVVDAMFIDGDHSTAATAADIAEAMARSMLLILIHDVKYPSVRQALPEPDKWLILPTEHGIGVRWLSS